MYEDVFLAAAEYFGILSVPITLITIAALSDEIILTMKRAIIPYVRSRRR